MMANSRIRILENLCRTCMGEQQTEIVPATTKQPVKSLISIYHKHEANDSGNINIMELLKQTSPQLTIETDDMLPKNICETCLDMLVNIHEFQKKSLRVEKRMRNIIKESPEIDVDPLNNNVQQDGGGEDLKNEIDDPLREVTTPVKGFFTLLQKDGQIIEVYNALEKCEKEISGWSEKFNTDDDVGGNGKSQDTVAREAKTNEKDNLSDAMFWKYITGYQGEITGKEDQNSKGEGFTNGEVKSNLHRHERKGKWLDRRTRILRKSTRELKVAAEISDEGNNRKQKSDNEDVDREKSHPTITARTNVMKEVAEEESLAREVSDCNDTSVEDDIDWEPPLNKSERSKCKSIENVNKLEGNQQDNLDPKHEDKKIVSVKLHTRGFTCNECGERLKTRLGFKMHIKRHLKNKQKQHNAENGYICAECGARLKTRVTYRRHLLIHEKDETKIKYKCQYCNKVFNQSCALRLHARMHTGERPYLCSICGKSYATQCSLKLHYGRHGTELNYQCPNCPKRFRCSSSMSTHKAIVHSTARPHVCDVCGASFKKPYALRKHKIIHGEKKHKCDYCEMKFAQPDQCRRHMRTHTGEKPYKCRYCERAYAQSNDMIKHLRVHLGDNVYRCEMCPQAFRLMCELRAHFASHKDDDEQTKFKNLQALKAEEERIQAKIESAQATEQQS